MCIDVYNREIGKIIAYGGNRRSREGVLATNCEGELSALQDFMHCLTLAFRAVA